VELLEPVRPRSYISFRADSLNLSGSAAVRHCTRRCGKFLVGLEFSGGLKLAKLPSQSTVKTNPS